MEHQKDIIYIPYWIAGMLERNNLPLSEVLNYNKMSNFLSTQEQANMLLMQNIQMFDSKLSQTVTQLRDEEAVRHYEPEFNSNCSAHTSVTEIDFSYTLATAWKRSIVGSGSANNNALKLMLDNASSFAHSEITKDEVMARMNPVDAPPQKHTQPFITYDVERDVVIVVVYPGFFNCDAYKANTFALLVAVLKVLYAYNSYASVCKTPYFRKYLEKLAASNSN